MVRYATILLLGILLGSGCSQDNTNTLEVTYIGNEGFMISTGSTKVLIDALPRSDYYATPSDSLTEKIVNGIPPFDGVEYFLVTHDHADHFNAELALRFLLKHPASQFVAGPEACAKLVGDSIAERRRTEINLRTGEHGTVRGERAEIIALRLEHGGSATIDNLAFIVRSNGHTVVHVGDAKLSDNEKYLRTIDWGSVDILFAEYFDQSTQTQEIMQKLIKPEHVILMHIPPGEEISARNVNGKIYPRTVVFGKESETIRFDNTVDDVSTD
jgi:L-ascorbate metabolism protein UlaG (beta-lactamase superfamily)